MSDRVEVFEVTTPAGTAKASFIRTSLSFAEGIVRRVEIVFPDGCVGMVGGRIEKGTTQVWPITDGGFLVANYETLGFDVENVPQGGMWQLASYNTGTKNHTLYVRLFVDEIPSRGQGAGARAPAVPVATL